MLQTNKRISIQRSFKKRKILLHPETIRSILRFTHGSALRAVPWLPYPTLTTMGHSFISRSLTLRIKLFYHSHLQRSAQPEDFNSTGLSTFHEKVKKEIRTIKSILKGKTK